MNAFFKKLIPLTLLLSIVGIGLLAPIQQSYPIAVNKTYAQNAAVEAARAAAEADAAADAADEVADAAEEAAEDAEKAGQANALELRQQADAARAKATEAERAAQEAQIAAGNSADAAARLRTEESSQAAAQAQAAAKNSVVAANETREVAGEAGHVPACSISLLNFSFKACMAELGNSVLGLFGLILWGSGVTLNASINLTVLEMGQLNNVEAIGTAWQTLRDLANIFFIFILLAIAIATILGIEGYSTKSLLAKVIIIALLINFSLFVTKGIIDGTNMVAVQFYKNMTAGCPGGAQGDYSLSCGDAGISDKFMEALKLPTIYQTNSLGERDTIANAGLIQRGLVSESELTYGRIFLITTLGSIFILIAAFIFFAAAILFAARYAILIILMVLSPLAFIAMALPRTASYAKQWWEMLFKQALFAPAYLILVWLSFHIIGDPNFITGKGELNFATALSGNTDSAVVFLNYMIVAAFMIFALVAAKQLGAYGASGLIQTGQSLRKWGQARVGGAALGGSAALLRNTVGRGASKLASLEGAKNMASKRGWKGTYGRLQLKSLRGVAGSSMDARATGAGGALAGKLDLGKAGGKGGYEQTLKTQVESRTKFADSLGKRKATPEQEKEQKTLETGLVSAKAGVKNAEARVRGAKSMVERERAQEEVHAAQNTLSETETKLKAFQEQHRSRQEEYAESLEKDKILWQVPRKNKEAAEKIKDNLRKKKDSDLKKKLAEWVKSEPEVLKEITPEEKPA